MTNGYERWQSMSRRVTIRFEFEAQQQPLIDSRPFRTRQEGVLFLRRRSVIRWKGARAEVCVCV